MDPGKSKKNLLAKSTSIRGSSLDAMAKYFPEDYWTPAMTEELLIYSYGVIASKMTKRSYFSCPCFAACCGCTQFPHTLPHAESIVKEAYTQFTTTYKFTDRLTEHSIDMETMEEAYAAERRARAEEKIEQAEKELAAAASRRANNRGGAPPSADNV